MPLTRLLCATAALAALLQCPSASAAASTPPRGYGGKEMLSQDLKCRACEGIVSFVEAEMNRVKFVEKRKKDRARQIMNAACEFVHENVDVDYNVCTRVMDSVRTKVRDYIMDNNIREGSVGDLCRTPCVAESRKVQQRLEDMDLEYAELVREVWEQAMWDYAPYFLGLLLVIVLLIRQLAVAIEGQRAVARKQE